jgi:chemotaxis protein MotA
MCYGVVGPIAKNLELKHHGEQKILEAIKAALLAFSKDIPPRIAVEFGRRVLFGDEKPGFSELEEALKKK